MNRVDTLPGQMLSPEATLRDAMDRINRQTPESQFQLVADADGRLLGTITDGDIRRAILRGVGIDDPATACMNTAPVTGRDGEIATNAEKLQRVATHSPFLPVLSADGRVVEILLPTGLEAQPVAALVMAGGYGRRLGERTRDMPKPLLQVGDRPILAHILERLDSVVVSETFVSVHFLADRVEEFLRDHDSGSRIGILRETEPLGTAGAIGLLPETMETPFLVLNGDVLTSLDFGAFVAFHAAHDYDATIAVARHEVAIPYGVVRHAGDGSFLGIEEKPVLTNFVAAGIYLLSPGFRALVGPGERLDMPELLQRGQKIGLRTGLFPIHEYWTDVGDPEDLAAAERDHGNG